MKKLLFLLCLLAQPAFAQTHEIDSLKRGLALVQKHSIGRSSDSLAQQYVAGLMGAYAAIQVDSALHYNVQLCQLLQRRHHESDLIDVHLFAGYLNLLKGSNHERVRCLYKALVVAEKQNATNKIAAIYSQMAHAYLTLKDYKKSQLYCVKGLQLLKKYPDTNTEMELSNIYGINFQENKKYQLALERYMICNKLAKISKASWYEAQSLNEIGWVYQDLKQPDKALSYYRQALQLARKTNNTDVGDNSLISLTSLLMKQRDWSEALRYSRLVESRSIETKNTPYLLNIYQKQYVIYKQIGRFATSLAIHEKYVNLKDSVSRETNQSRIDALQAQYENSQKDNLLKKQQVQLLSQQNSNQQLAQARNRLFAGISSVMLIAGLLFWNNRRLRHKNQQISQQSMLLEKARIQLADLNQSLEIRVQARTHDLSEANAELLRKNEEIKGALFKGQTIERKRVAVELHDNLSSLLSALNMSIQGIDPNGLSVKEQIVYHNIRQMMNNAYAEVRNISHNILPTELEQNGLYSVLAEMVTKLNENTPIHFSFINTVKTRLPVEIEFNLYSICLELINNVIRHSQATEAIINFCPYAGGIRLTVSDNGQGFTEQSKRGMGLKNSQSRLDALGGVLLIEVNKPNGTKIGIQLPAEYMIKAGN